MHSPDVPITTNFHGPIQAVDWHEWGPHIDLVSWDSYPRIDSPVGARVVRTRSGAGELTLATSSW